MATVAFLIETAEGGIELTPALAERLAGLGVTNVTLYRDRETLCVVLEGWAFDPSSSAAAASVLGVSPQVRTLRPVMQTALGAAR